MGIIPCLKTPCQTQHRFHLLPKVASFCLKLLAAVLTKGFLKGYFWDPTEIFFLAWHLGSRIKRQESPEVPVEGEA